MAERDPQCSAFSTSLFVTPPCASEKPLLIKKDVLLSAESQDHDITAFKTEDLKTEIRQSTRASCESVGHVSSIFVENAEYEAVKDVASNRLVFDGEHSNSI